MEAVRARWSSWSFLVYTGGLGLVVVAGAWLDYLDRQTGPGIDVLWALLVLAVLGAKAEAFARTGHRVTAGVLAFGAVAAFVAVLVQLVQWLGWTISGPVAGFHPARLLITLLWIGAAVAALRRYRFPMIVGQLVFALWWFVTDLVSNGGTWTAVVTVALGFAALAVASMLDATPRRPYAFWVHVGAGLMIGGGAIYCIRHGGTVAWLLILAAAVAYVWISRTTGRSSWAVLGTLGIFIAATHFALKWERFSLFFFGGGHRTHPWAALVVYTGASALVVALGLWVSRRPAAD